ncbi:MAG TPA: efflux RND transporter periplasmic adaptor subunit [Vicinamibacteria bacterium]|nr:efflux RND transporter periplasmic adaptor subunit [Vicinamibacteria bacterium]
MRNDWLVFLTIAAAVACGREDASPEHPLRPVRTMEVFSTGGMRARSFSGVAQAAVESTLSFRVRGNIERLLVRTGDSVQPGQIIAELDPTDYQLQLQEAEAALSQAEAQARQAEADYDRVRGLYENRNASRSDLDAARARSESANAQIDAAIQRVEQARSQLSYTRLRAPVSGSIAAVPVEVNENADAGKPIAVLTSGERPKVDVPVPESLIGEVRQGDAVEVAFDALPGRRFPAEVVEVGVMSTTLATAFPVRVQLTNAEPDVRAGMAARVSFTFGSQDSRKLFVLPPHAVVEDRAGRFVFVVEAQGDGKGVVRRRAVSVGELTGEGLEVLEGLENGDRVVTAGVSQIEDGLTVRFEG